VPHENLFDVFAQSFAVHQRFPKMTPAVKGYTFGFYSFVNTPNNPRKFLGRLRKRNRCTAGEKLLIGSFPGTERLQLLVYFFVDRYQTNAVCRFALLDIDKSATAQADNIVHPDFPHLAIPHASCVNEQAQQIQLLIAPSFVKNPLQLRKLVTAPRGLVFISDRYIAQVRTGIFPDKPFPLKVPENPLDRFHTIIDRLRFYSQRQIVILEIVQRFAVNPSAAGNMPPFHKRDKLIYHDRMIVPPGRIRQRPVPLLLTCKIFGLFGVKCFEQFESFAVMILEIPADQALTIVAGKPFRFFQLCGMAVPFTRQHLPVMRIPDIIHKSTLLVFPFYQVKPFPPFRPAVIPINNSECLHHKREFPAYVPPQGRFLIPLIAFQGTNRRSQIRHAVPPSSLRKNRNTAARLNRYRLLLKWQGICFSFANFFNVNSLILRTRANSSALTSRDSRENLFMAFLQYSMFPSRFCKTLYAFFMFRTSFCASAMLRITLYNSDRLLLLHPAVSLSNFRRNADRVRHSPFPESRATQTTFCLYPAAYRRSLNALCRSTTVIIFIYLLIVTSNGQGIFPKFARYESDVLSFFLGHCYFVLFF
jgi:hypothetical protein